MQLRSIVIYLYTAEDNGLLSSYRFDLVSEAQVNRTINALTELAQDLNLNVFVEVR